MNDLFRLRLPDDKVNGAIPYLDEENVEKYSDVTIKSIIDNASISLNKLMLAALMNVSHANAFEHTICEDEDIVVLCEYPFSQLRVLKNFVNFGKLPQPAKALRKLVSFEENGLFTAFGIDLCAILSKKSWANSESNVESLSESFNEAIFEDLSNFESFDGLNQSESDDENLSSKRQRRSYRINKSESSSEHHLGGIITDQRIVGFMKFPEDVPVAPAKGQEKKLEKLESYKEKYRDYIKIGNIPQVDREGLLAYNLPQPIESYLKFARSDDDDEVMPAGKGKFSCSLCGSKCQTDAALRKHKRKYHASKYFCPSCGKNFQKRVWFNFIRHMYQHTITDEAIVHECICCGYQADSIARIDLHRDASGPFHNNECTQCPEKLLSHHDYAVHVEKHHGGNWTFRCGICPLTFNSKKEAGKHIGDAHKNKKAKNVICEMCGKAFTNEAHLNAHLGSKKCNKEFDRPLLKCEMCTFVTKFQPYLNKHIRTVHEKLTCTHCGKIVPKSRMNLHMVIFHTDNASKPFQCSECGKGFATRKSFQEHMNIHTGERPYQCDLCEKRFASSGNMYMHRRSSHLGYRRAK